MVLQVQMVLLLMVLVERVFVVSSAFQVEVSVPAQRNALTAQRVLDYPAAPYGTPPQTRVETACLMPFQDVLV
jgi:hypothetical protein